MREMRLGGDKRLSGRVHHKESHERPRRGVILGGIDHFQNLMRHLVVGEDKQDSSLDWHEQCGILGAASVSSGRRDSRRLPRSKVTGVP